jgi:hypothetical protein
MILLFSSIIAVFRETEPISKPMKQFISNDVWAVDLDDI